MDIFQFAEKIMSMDDKAWSRHANPWSGYSRFSCLPLIALALWSRTWLGWWCLLPLGIALFWTWLNPRLFDPPRYTHYWVSKGSFGERVFINRKSVAIPLHHERMAVVLAIASVPGMVMLIYGLVALNGWSVTAGVIAAMAPKLWFIDRMVWLYEDMKDQYPEYRAWLRMPDQARDNLR